jgi:hypothetical protein
MHGIWISDASRRKIIEYKLKGHNSPRPGQFSEVVLKVGRAVIQARRGSRRIEILDSRNS